MSYYDRIAKRWHDATGFRGGAFKEFALNERIHARIPQLSGAAVLELGAGTGYFAAMMQDRFSGQSLRRHVISDQSKQLLVLAKRHFRVADAEYIQLDVRSEFPFESADFDLVLATMVFNEVTTGGLKRALLECRRVLRHGGKLLATVLHPDFVASLAKRGELRRDRSKQMTMPGANGLRLPIVSRSRDQYERLLRGNGFCVESEEVFANAKVLHAKPGLLHAGTIPLALIFDCRVDLSRD